MQESQIIESVERNFYKASGQYQVISNERVWVKLSARDILHLLKNCKLDVKPVANKLLKEMAEKKWTVTATAHKGGKSENAPLHISIRVGKQIAHHLNAKEKKGSGLYLYEVSQKPINYT